MQYGYLPHPPYYYLDSDYIHSSTNCCTKTTSYDDYTFVHIVFLRCIIANMFYETL